MTDARHRFRHFSGRELRPTYQSLAGCRVESLEEVLRPYNLKYRYSSFSLNVWGVRPPEKYHLEREYHLGFRYFGVL